MASWFRQTSGSYVHADTSRLRQMMQDWVEDQPSGGAAYHNFWDHPYARTLTLPFASALILPFASARDGYEPFASKFVRKLSRATLQIRILQRRFRNRRWRRVQRYLVDIGLNRFGDPKRGLLYYTLHMP